MSLIGSFCFAERVIAESNHRDDTAAIQEAIDSNQAVRLGAGTFHVNPAVGLIVRNGTSIAGEGKSLTVIRCLPGAGSIFKRAPIGGGENPEVGSVQIRDLGIEFSHAGDYDQIGFDFRHISQSTIRDCYVGNFSPMIVPGSRETVPAPSANGFRGYGVVFGTLSTGTPAYCGGNFNSVEGCQIWGVRKGISIDDEVLGGGPASHAHGTRVSNNHIRFCRSGISIESVHNAGCSLTDNTIRFVQRAPGGPEAYAYRLEGYGSRLVGGFTYVSNGTCNQVVHLGAGSRNNVIDTFYASNPVPAIRDLGTGNVVRPNPNL